MTPDVWPDVWGGCPLPRRLGDPADPGYAFAAPGGGHGDPPLRQIAVTLPFPPT